MIMLEVLRAVHMLAEAGELPFREKELILERLEKAEASPPGMRKLEAMAQFLRMLPAEVLERAAQLKDSEEPHDA